MKKWLSPLLVTSCLVAISANIAQAASQEVTIKKTQIAKYANAQVNKLVEVDAFTLMPLHVRSGPNNRYPSIDVLPGHTALNLGDCTRYWCEVIYRSDAKTWKKGWSNIPYLAIRETSPYFTQLGCGQHQRKITSYKGYYTPVVGKTKTKATSGVSHTYANNTQAAAYTTKISQSNINTNAETNNNSLSDREMNQNNDRAMLENAEHNQSITRVNEIGNDSDLKDSVQNTNSTPNEVIDKTKQTENQAYYTQKITELEKQNQKLASALQEVPSLKQCQEHFSYAFHDGSTQQQYNAKQPASGWWTNYNRPSYKGHWEPRWWQKH